MNLKDIFLGIGHYCVVIGIAYNTRNVVEMDHFEIIWIMSSFLVFMSISSICCFLLACDGKTLESIPMVLGLLIICSSLKKALMSCLTLARVVGFETSIEAWHQPQILFLRSLNNRIDN